MTPIDQAVACLLAGELVALPTETVYGLGADASNAEAVGRIFAAKSRPADHPLIVHLAGTEHLDQWARDIPPAARALARAFWPGPLTLILKKQPWVPLAVTGGQETVGLRVPSHPLALELLAAFALACTPAGIAAPSANRFGHISPTTAAHVQEELGDQVSLILDGGPCEVGIESTIVDLSRDVPEILRPGIISPDDIASIAGNLPHVRNQAKSPRVSGSLAVHYAPRTPLMLVTTSALPDELVRLTGRRIAVLAHSPDTGQAFHWQAASHDPRVYARQLYANLRLLDSLGAELILVEAVPPDWRAVTDRLTRASNKKFVL